MDIKFDALRLNALNTPSFLQSHENSLIVLFVVAEFAPQLDLVEKAIIALKKSIVINQSAIVAYTDAEENMDLTEKYNIVIVPTILVIHGEFHRKIDTLEPEKMISLIEEEIKKRALMDVDYTTPDKREQLNNYLKGLINRASVMVFMKGEPKAPRCGFSRQLVDLLAKHHIKYESYDILQDEDVRQGLKEYSDWPTYPQIYVKGAFIGGLDVLNQLVEAGELEKTLKV